MLSSLGRLSILSRAFQIRHGYSGKATTILSMLFQVGHLFIYLYIYLFIYLFTHLLIYIEYIILTFISMILAIQNYEYFMLIYVNQINTEINYNKKWPYL